MLELVLAMVTDPLIKASFSFGIASYPEEAKNLEALIKIADQRMYEHKKEKNRRNDDKSIFSSNSNTI